MIGMPSSSYPWCVNFSFPADRIRGVISVSFGYKRPRTKACLSTVYTPIVEHNGATIMRPRNMWFLCVDPLKKSPRATDPVSSLVIWSRGLVPSDTIIISRLVFTGLCFWDFNLPLILCILYNHGK